MILHKSFQYYINKRQCKIHVQLWISRDKQPTLSCDIRYSGPLVKNVYCMDTLGHYRMNPIDFMIPLEFD